MRITTLCQVHRPSSLKWSMTVLINFLEGLCKTCRKDLPHLREVNYLEPCAQIMCHGQVRHVAPCPHHRVHTCPSLISRLFQAVSESLEQNSVRLGATMVSGDYCFEDLD